MEINIGDKVRFLNEVGGGTVSGFQKGGIVLVEDEDGFDVPVSIHDVVVIPKDNRKQTAAYQQPVETKASNNTPSPSDNKMTPIPQAQKTQTAAAADNDDTETLEERILRLEVTVRRLQMRLERLEDAKALREKTRDNAIKKANEQRRTKDDILEVDLHINELLDTTRGMSAADIKAYQMETFRNTLLAHKNEKGRRIVFIHGNGEGVLRKAILDELKHSFKGYEYQDASFQQYGFGATMVTIK